MKKRLKFSLTASLAMVMFAFMVPDSGYKVGDRVKNFRLKNVDGKQVSLTDYNYDDAKGFIVIFTCNHCPYAKAYEQRIIDLDKKYAEKGYPVIAINPNDAEAYPEDSYQNMVKRAKSKKYPFPYLHDETQEVARTFGALKTPHVYILKKEADALTVAYIGAIDDNSEDAALVKDKYVENAVEELLAGKAVSVPETKAIGCSVKYRK